jgi:hypothetical protein
VPGRRQWRGTWAPQEPGSLSQEERGDVIHAGSASAKTEIAEVERVIPVDRDPSPRRLLGLTIFDRENLILGDPDRLAIYDEDEPIVIVEDAIDRDLIVSSGPIEDAVVLHEGLSSTGCGNS